MNDEDSPFHLMFQQFGHEHLAIRDSELSKMIELDNALDAIINHDFYFYHPASVTLRVINVEDEFSGRKKNLTQSRSSVF